MKVQYQDGQYLGTLDGNPLRIREYDRFITADELDPTTGIHHLCSRERLAAGVFEPSVLYYDTVEDLADEASLRTLGLRGGYNPQFKTVYAKNRSSLHSPTGRWINRA